MHARNVIVLVVYVAFRILIQHKCQDLPVLKNLDVYDVISLIESQNVPVI